jgi:hypothetical protein
MVALKEALNVMQHVCLLVFVYAAVVERMGNIKHKPRPLHCLQPQVVLLEVTFDFD